MSSPGLIDGKYELLELAGEGGMASVWKAQVRGAAGFSRMYFAKLSAASACRPARSSLWARFSSTAGCGFSRYACRNASRAFS